MALCRFEQYFSHIRKDEHEELCTLKRRSGLKESHLKWACIIMITNLLLSVRTPVFGAAVAGRE